jgi:hypothetical protein
MLVYVRKPKANNMGVKLDWDIEAEQGKQKEHKEDFQQRSARYLAFGRLLIGVLVFAGILGGIVYLVYQRWEQVNQRLEQVLVDTVQAEIAALRVGNFDDYINMQRSASDDWLISQRAVYESYQTLKSTANVTLSGRVISVAVDGERGRIQIEEIIDNVPYVQTWFYWRYSPIVDEDGKEVDAGGWRHVPPDYTFWGEAATIEHDNFVIRYQTVDELTAQGVAEDMQRWLDDACSFLDCAALPLITIDIVANPLPEARWAEGDSWQLIIPSPYLGRARADIPFSGQLQQDSASLLASRLLDGTTSTVPAYPADAFFLREAVNAWLVGRFVQLSSESYLISSLVDNYGLQTIPSLLQNLQEQSDISILATVAGVATVADLNVDWRDYLGWRVALEDEFIQRGDELSWASLYDFRDENLRTIAYSRYNNNFVADTRTILDVGRSNAADGSPQLVLRSQVTRGFDSGEEIVVFNLVNGFWLRAN